MILPCGVELNLVLGVSIFLASKSDDVLGTFISLKPLQTICHHFNDPSLPTPKNSLVLDIQSSVTTFPALWRLLQECPTMHMMFRTDKFNKILGTPTYFADDGDDRLVFRNGHTMAMVQCSTSLPTSPTKFPVLQHSLRR